MTCRTTRRCSACKLNDRGQPQIAHGTAPDRIISITDPEMRHGRKSRAQRFDGFKVAVSSEQTSELILDVADISAVGSDGQELLPTIERVDQHADVLVARALGDGAYGSGANRAACATHPSQQIDLVAPLALLNDPAVAKSAFAIDLVAETATCPQGHTVTAQAGAPQLGLPTLRFTFPRTTCEACPLFARCVKSKTTGRTVNTHPYETYLQAARQRQQTDEFKTLCPLRSAIERKQAELVQHGLRDTRYPGQPQRQLQRLWTAAEVNLKRLCKLGETRQVELAVVFKQLPAHRYGLLPT